MAQPQLAGKNNARYTVVVPLADLELFESAELGGLNFRQVSQLAIRQFAANLRTQLALAEK